jgi:hypothetical protein
VSGETEKFVSGWTVDTLNSHIDEILRDRDPARAAWTLLTLKEFLERKIDEVARQFKEGDAHIEALATERNNRYDERATKADKAIEVGLAESKGALATAFASANLANVEAKQAHKETHESEAKALEIATTNIEAKLAEMNNLRDQINRERATFVTLDVLSARLTAATAPITSIQSSHDARITELTAARGRDEGRGAGFEKLWGYFFAVATLGIAAGVFLHSLIK